MTPQNKGARLGAEAEEVLREYFQEAGYFVVRGVPYIHDDSAISDIDLWLYLRPSPFARLRGIVDAKRTNRPRAAERIVWTLGLRDILGVDQAIVATTDNRPSVAEFGRKHGVLVLDGEFQQRLLRRFPQRALSRLADEELCAAKGGVPDSWKACAAKAKERLLLKLEFDGCNAWLADVGFFAQAYIGERDSVAGPTAARLFYLMIAYFLIGLDFVAAELAVEPEEPRIRALADGFRFGSGGRERVDRMLRQVGQLVAAYLPSASGVIARVSVDAERQLASVPAEVLAQYFGGADRIRSLFRLAIEFEKAAYLRSFKHPSELDIQLQGTISVFLDYFGIDRSLFFREPTGAQATGAGPEAPKQLTLAKGKDNSPPALDSAENE